MNFLSLSYFLVVAEELSFTKAAKRLYISQQSLSSHISRLEKYFGTSLFLRTAPLTLTPAGAYLCEEARKMIRARDNLRQELSDIEHFDSGVLSVGSTPSRTRSMLPRAFRIFHHRYPNIKLQLFEGTTPEVEEQLLKGALDLSIGFLPQDASNIVSLPLCDERFFVIVPVALLREYFRGRTDEVIAQLDTAFDIRLIQDLPFLTMPHSKLNAIFNLYMEEKGISPRILMEVNSIDTLLAFCNEGLGVIVCSSTLLYHSYSDIEHFKLYPIESSYAKRSIVVNYLANRYLSRAAQEFIEAAREVFTI